MTPEDPPRPWPFRSPLQKARAAVQLVAEQTRNEADRLLADPGMAARLDPRLWAEQLQRRAEDLEDAVELLYGVEADQQPLRGQQELPME